MTVAKLERWISLLPSQERAQPVITVDNIMLTPEDMLREARAETELGRKAQYLWEAGALGTEEELLIERVRRRLERYPSDKPLFFVLGAPSALTPRDILANIEQRTLSGQKFLQNERTYLKYLSSLKER